MEVGLNIGGPELGGSASRKVQDVPSVKMWQEFFPRSHVLGVDISDFSDYQNDHFTFFRADCGNIDDLKRVVSTAPQCDIIIDDGSHASYHQQTTFIELFKIVKGGGIYVIEDLDWQPTEYEAKLPRVPKTRDLLRDFIRTGAFIDTGSIPASRWSSLKNEIENVMLVETAKLNEMGSIYNKLNSIATEHYDQDARPAMFSARHLKQSALRGVDLLRYLAGNGLSARNTVKVAVIQKRHTAI
ncbi:hypothetical protein R1A27_29220 [Methylobacterium sp. NMS12]|uniref:hypothetical protein n=1 Tax=Methylobacterium sp. NMS12 TaxID=3079766 RepID=UPI003F88582A